MIIREISKEIHQTNVEKGFWEDKATKNVGEVLMLCVSELSEALEAHRKGKHAIKSFNLDQHEEWDLTNPNDAAYYAQEFQVAIKDSFEDEIADTVIRLFDLCEGFGIDLEYHIRMKLNYNKTRPFKHGKAY